MWVSSDENWISLLLKVGDVQRGNIHKYDHKYDANTKVTHKKILE